MASLIYGTAAHHSADISDYYDLASPGTPGYRTYRNRQFAKLRLYINAIGDTLEIRGKYREEDDYINLHISDGLNNDVNEFVELICPRYLVVVRTEGAPGTDSKVVLDD